MKCVLVTRCKDQRRQLIQVYDGEKRNQKPGLRVFRPCSLKESIQGKNKHIRARKMWAVKKSNKQKEMGVVTFGVGMNRIVPARPTQHPDETYTHTSGPPPTPYCLLLLVRGHIYPPVFAKKIDCCAKGEPKARQHSNDFFNGRFHLVYNRRVAQQRNQRKTRRCMVIGDPCTPKSWFPARLKQGEPEHTPVEWSRSAR